MWSEPNPAAIRVEIEWGPAKTVVRVFGELDLGTVDAFERALPSAGKCAARVVLDLSDVTFCAVAGARVIAQWSDQVEADGGWVLLRGADGSVLRVLETVGLRTWFVEPQTDDDPVRPGDDPVVATTLLASVMRQALLIIRTPTWDGA